MKSEELSKLTNAQKLGLIEALTLSPGWAILKEWIENEIESEDILINTVNPEQNKVVYTEKDIHILNKNNLKEIIDKPNEWLHSLKDVSPKGPTLSEALNDINSMSSAIPSSPLL